MISRQRCVFSVWFAKKSANETMYSDIRSDSCLLCWASFIQVMLVFLPGACHLVSNKIQSSLTQSAFEATALASNLDCVTLMLAVDGSLWVYRLIHHQIGSHVINCSLVCTHCGSSQNQAGINRHVVPQLPSLFSSYVFSDQYPKSCTQNPDMAHVMPLPKVLEQSSLMYTGSCQVEFIIIYTRLNTSILLYTRPDAKKKILSAAASWACT